VSETVSLGGFLPERDCQIIGQILRARKTLPDDFWGVAAVQEVASFIARNEGILSDADCAILVGIGAIIANQAHVEMEADIQARMAIARARG
jgi:hypothetical protein